MSIRPFKRAKGEPDVISNFSNCTLGLIISFVGQPTTTSLVSKKFLEVTTSDCRFDDEPSISTFKELWKAYKRDPFLGGYVKRTVWKNLKVHQLCVRAVYEGVVERALKICSPLPRAAGRDTLNPLRLSELSKAIDIYTFFTEVSTHLEEAQSFRDCLRGDIFKRVAKIRAWLNNHSNQLLAIKDLNLSGQDLCSLPEQIGLFTRLKTLDLSNNWLKTLPEELAKCERLNSLNIGLNDITSLPERIGRCASSRGIMSHNNPVVLHSKPTID